MAEDAAVVALLESGFQDVVALSEDVVGSLPVPLSAARPDIRVQEVPLGNLICASMLHALAQSVRSTYHFPLFSQQQKVVYTRRD